MSVPIATFFWPVKWRGEGENLMYYSEDVFKVNRKPATIFDSVRERYRLFLLLFQKRQKTGFYS